MDRPISAVWEVTMGCNLRCKHCGSSCQDALPDELNTEEALCVCDQLGDIGVRWVTLSGGEALTRRDWPALAGRLSQHGVLVNFISNGTLIDEKTVEKLIASGAKHVTISIEATRDLHDKIRAPGSYDQGMTALRRLGERGLSRGVVTTVTQENISGLWEIRAALEELGVPLWQIQMGLPMGNLAQRPHWVLKPGQIAELIDFAYAANQKGGIAVVPGDCIGYYTRKEIIARQMAYRSNALPVWDGCNAGIRTFSILQNGDVTGCTSLRHHSFVEGNVKERPLRDIWDDPTAFGWRRNMTPDVLDGFCRDCRYAPKCLGGCSSLRFTTQGTLQSENPYCAYHNAHTAGG